MATKAKKDTAAKAETKVEEVKAEAVQAEVKEEVKAEPAKKTAAKKTATKATEKSEEKATAKKTATKKVDFIVQFSGMDFSYDDLIEKVKADYIAQTGKKTMSSATLYFKPEDKTVYYVVGGDFEGRVYVG